MKDITNSFVPTYDIICDSDDDEIWVQKPPQKGDHIRVQRMNGLYAHHGVYVSDSEVIHFTGADDDSILDWDKPKVISTDLAAFLKGGTLEVKEYTDEEFADLYSPEQIIVYARACLGDKGYNLIFNNCEHFANVCTLGRFRSNQVDNFFNQLDKVFGSILFGGYTKMSIFSTITSVISKIPSAIGAAGSVLFGGGSRNNNSSGTRTTATTTYEPDKVRVAEFETKRTDIATQAKVKETQINAENQIRLSELETERIELRKQAQKEIIREQADAQIAIEEAKAKGFTVMAQTILTLQEKLNEVAEKRLLIIEKASMPIVKEIEQFYGELDTKIREDNTLYSKEKLPELLNILNQFPPNSPAQTLYLKQIENDMANQFKHYSQQIDNVAKRQEMVLNSFLKGKEQIIGQTEALTKTMLENLSQKAQLTSANISGQLPNFASQKQLKANEKPALENK